MIRVFDAFSGIGGFRSAFERVGGFKTVGWCEIDRFAQKSYRALFDTGGEQFYENIRTIDTTGLADFDLLVGGFPCQPYPEKRNIPKSLCKARRIGTLLKKLRNNVFGCYLDFVLNMCYDIIG